MSRFSDAVRERLTHLLSLSERALRALFTVAVGASTLLTESLFPEALRGTTTYRVTIGLMQQYIVERVAGMETEVAAGQVELGGNYVQRKMVGTALEAAGLLAMSFSPLWVLAIVGDVAGGSKVYLNRLVEYLKANHVVALNAKVTGLADLLEAIQDVAGQSATAIDAPPLSREELSALVGELKSGYGRALDRTSSLMPELDDIWATMERLTRREEISMERLGGIMTADVLSWSRKGAGLVRSVGQTGAELFGEGVLDSYRRTLAAVSEQGVDRYVSDHMQPFLQAARSHFDAGRATWIERKLGGRATDTE